jgi:hypothetical protein
MSQTPQSQSQSHSQQPIRIDWPAIYTAQHAALTPQQVDQILAQGRQWQLGDVLQAGGVVVFPHAAVLDCGYQVAAAVIAALDSGAHKVLVVSVLHAWTATMAEARNRLAAGEDLTAHPLRGIQGPEVSNSRDEWRLDHALISWRFFWNAECERRRLSPQARPIVCEVYPFLAGDQPQTLFYYDEIAKWAEDAVIVSTADPFHHGIGYGDADTVARAPHDGGLVMAHASIEESNRLLAQGDYSAYLQHCVRARNDARDAGPLFRELSGPLQPEFLDLAASDMATIYDAPPPTWVAAALVAWHKN